MWKPIKVGDKWQGRVRKTGFPSVSENFNSYQDASNFIIKTKASMLALKHNDVRTVKNMTIGSIIDSYVKAKEDEVETQEGEPFGKNKAAVLKALKRDLGAVVVPHFTFDRIKAYIKGRQKAGAGGVTIGIDLTYLQQTLMRAQEFDQLPMPMGVVPKARSNFKYMALSPTSRQVTVGRPMTKSHALKRRLLRNVAKRSRCPILSSLQWRRECDLGEICRIRWADINEEHKTVLIRDRKHPTMKKGNHQNSWNRDCHHGWRSGENNSARSPRFCI